MLIEPPVRPPKDRPVSQRGRRSEPWTVSVLRQRAPEPLEPISGVQRQPWSRAKRILSERSNDCGPDLFGLAQRQPRSDGGRQGEQRAPALAERVGADSKRVLADRSREIDVAADIARRSIVLRDQRIVR